MSPSGGTALSTDTATEAAPTLNTGEGLLRGALVALAIALLVGGAIYVGGRQPEGRSAMLSAFEAQDGAAIAERIVPETVPGVPLERIAQVLDERFAAGATLVSQRTVEAGGQRLVEVVTSDGLILCERPNGAILVNCRVGQSVYEVVSAPETLTVEFAGVEVFPEQAQVQLVVAAAGSDPVSLSQPVVVTVDGQEVTAQVEVTELGAFGPGAPVTGDITIEPGGAVLVMLVVDAADAAQLLRGQVAVTIGDQELVFQPGEAADFLR